jgi:hypothetical protein
MHDEGLAKKVRQFTVEQLLLEWLEAFNAKDDANLPVYKAHLRELGGRKIWSLDFRASNPKYKVPAQNFIVYGTERESLPSVSDPD